VAKKQAGKNPPKRSLLSRKPKAHVIERVEVYRKSKDDWRWRAQTSEQKVVARSEVGFPDREQAHAAASSFFPSTPVHDAA
jgi:uncharacterized protein YegP (UPF0339 family)